MAEQVRHVLPRPWLLVQPELLRHPLVHLLPVAYRAARLWASFVVHWLDRVPPRPLMEELQQEARRLGARLLVPVARLLLLPVATTPPHDYLQWPRLLLHLWPSLVAAPHLLPPVAPAREVAQLFGSDFALDAPETRVWLLLPLRLLAMLWPPF